MDQSVKRNNQEDVEIDLLHLAQVLLGKIWILIIAAVVCAVVAYVSVSLFVTPTYQASAMIYVNNSTVDVGSMSLSISNSDLTAAKSLANVYVIILEARTTLQEVIDRANLPYTYSQLASMVSASQVNSTEVLQVSVIGTDPDETKLIVDTIVEVLGERITDIINGSEPVTVDYAIKPTSKYGPDTKKYAMIGLFLGLVGSAGIIVVIDLLDNRVRDEEYLLQRYQIPVLAVIPDMSVEKSGGNYGYYGHQKPEKKSVDGGHNR